MVRTAKENGLITGMISLGLLATKLELSLLSIEENDKFKGNAAVLDHWAQILDETINFVQTPTKNDIVHKSYQSSPRFLARAPYLEHLHHAVPDADRKQLRSITAYLKKMRANIQELQEGKTLKSDKRDTLLAFVSSISRDCVGEASKFQKEPHPKWAGKPALAGTGNA